MIKEWNEYRLHLNAVFSTLEDQPARDLLRVIQAAVERHEAVTQVEGQSASVEKPVASDEQPEKGVSWNKTNRYWQVQVYWDGRSHAYGAYTVLGEANTQARGVRAYIEATGRLPEVGWRVPGLKRRSNKGK